MTVQKEHSGATMAMNDSGTKSNPFLIEDETVPDSGDGRLSVLGESLFIKGELQAAEDLLLEGRLEGSIKHTAQRLVIGRKGRVKADVHAHNLVIEGEVEGDVHCAESVVIQSSGVLRGNIFSPRLTIADGARFDGSVDMGSKSAGKRKADSGSG